MQTESLRIFLSKSFEAYNAPAVAAAAAHPTYKTVAALEVMRLHKIDDIQPAVTGLKLKLYSPTGEYLYTYIDSLYNEELMQRTERVNSGRAGPVLLDSTGRYRPAY